MKPETHREREVRALLKDSLVSEELADELFAAWKTVNDSDTTTDSEDTEIDLYDLQH